MRHLKRKLLTLSCSDPPANFFIQVLKVWTALLASLLEAGWYGTILTCWMPLTLTKSVNSLLVNDEPLLVTRISGSSKLANVNCNFSMITAVVEVLVMCTSIH